jgi:hypothetical protein
LAGLNRRLPDDGNNKPVLAAAADLDTKLLAVRDEMAQMKIRANEDSLRYPQKVDSKLAYLAMVVGDASDSAPTAASYTEFDKLKKQSEEQLARWSQLQSQDLAAFQKLAAGQNIQVIVVPAHGTPAAGGEEE